MGTKLGGVGNEQGAEPKLEGSGVKRGYGEGGRGINKRGKGKVESKLGIGKGEKESIRGEGKSGVKSGVGGREAIMILSFKGNRREIPVV